MTKKVAEVIAFLWECAETHLPHAVEDVGNCEYCGSKKFHKKTFKEYIDAIQKLL